VTISISVKLTKQEFEYLQNALTNKTDWAKHVHNGVIDENQIILQLEPDIADDIRDWAGEQLQKVGFKKDYEPTEEGLMLENIIDKFYH